MTQWCIPYFFKIVLKFCIVEVESFVTDYSPWETMSRENVLSDKTQPTSMHNQMPYVCTLSSQKEKNGPYKSHISSRRIQ